MSDIMATGHWPTNGHLIADVHALEYINDDDLVLDATYGEGTWWKVWRPPRLVTADRYPAEGVSVDVIGNFREPPFAPGTFDVVAFDPPYKLNGTPDPDNDRRFGVHLSVRWQERHELIFGGLFGCIGVLAYGGYLLVKCQDQVSSGAVRWQTDLFSAFAQTHGCTKVDRFDRIGHRRQPEGRRQVHARRNTSTLLVFRRGTR